MRLENVPSPISLMLAALLAVVLVAPPGIANAEWPVVGSVDNGSDAHLATIDRSTGVPTLVGYFGFGNNDVINGLAFDPNNRILYGVSPSYSQLFTIDQVTGHATPIGAPGALGYGNHNGLAYDSVNDILYATDNITDSLWAVDTTDSTGTQVAVIGGDFPGGDDWNVEGLAYDAETETLYGLADHYTGMQLEGRILVIDTTSGYASVLPGILPNGNWRGLTFDPQSGYLFASIHTPGFYRVDPVTGVGTYINNHYSQGLAVIPEPATLSLLALGGLAALRRRK